MMPGNTRSSRSRYSSPGQAPQGGGPLEASRSSANEGSRNFMRQWLEPAVQNKASHEEAGMVRYGVVENMQPLGSLPKGSAAAAKKAGPENNGPVRKIVLKSGGARKISAAGEAHKGTAPSRASNVPQGSSSRPSPAIVTPSPPPSSASLSPTFSPSLRSPPPRTKSSSALSLRKPASKSTSISRRDSPEMAPAHPEFPARHSPAMKDQDDDYQPKVSTKRTKPARSPAARRSVTRASAGLRSLPNPSTTVSESDGEPEEAAQRRRVVGKVVHEAVQNALDHHRYPSAYALRTLYDEHSSDPRVMAMFEDVFLQRADADTIDQFTTLVTGRKHEGARDGIARRHWALTGSPEKAVPAPYGNLLKNDQGEDTPAPKRKKTTHAASTTLSRSRRSGVGGNAEEPTTPTKSRGRSDSLDSDSSLSSVASFDSPVLDRASPSTAVKPNGDAGRPRPQIKLKARPSQGKQNPAGRQTRDTKGTGTGTSAGAAAVAGGRDDASGAHASGGGRPITKRGKTGGAQQRKSPAATSSSADSAAPARPEAPNNKNQDGRSSSPAISDTASSLPQHQPPGSRDGAGPGGIASAATRRDMPGAVAPLFPNLPVKTSGLRTALQSDTPNGDPKKRTPRGAAGRREASVASEARARSETPARKTRNASKPGAAATPAAAGSASRSTRSAVKRAHDEVDGTASPTASTFRSNAPSEAATRASTPALPPSKKQRVGPRVKTSPKKSGNTAAGVPRPTGEGANHLPGAGAVANRDQVENDDYCSACGGNGDLICCDSCSKSFHFECVDLVGSAELPDDWFCNDCIYKRSPQRPDHRGPFGPLLNLLEKTIPRAFSLPKKVQAYFEDIKAGVNGEYEEIDRTKTSRKEKNQEFDWFQQRDADGNAILCHGCQRAAAPDKLILPCSACPLWWHLDCLDSPAAHPPNPKKWVCPAHVGHILDENAPLGHRFRKVKGAQVVRPLYTRGMRNNGVIEVEDSEEEDASGWNDVRSYGRVLRLPSKGIKLDFIEQLRRSGAGHIAKGAGVSMDGPQAPSWDVADAEAAVSLCHLHDFQRAAPKNGAADNSDANEAAEPAKAPDTLTLLSQLQKGQLTQETLTAVDKQALRAAMDSIKTVLGDEQQESSVNDGIYDGASTTPEGSEEAVTPRAEAEKAEGRGAGDIRSGIEVVEGDVVGGLPEKGIPVRRGEGETKE